MTVVNHTTKREEKTGDQEPEKQISNERQAAGNRQIDRER
jgi:hypothetical protein